MKRKEESAIAEVFGRAKAAKVPEKRKKKTPKNRKANEYLGTVDNLKVPAIIAAEILRDAAKVLSHKRAKFLFENLAKTVELKRREESIICLVAAAFALGASTGRFNWQNRYFSLFRKTEGLGKSTPIKFRDTL